MTGPNETPTTPPPAPSPASAPASWTPQSALGPGFNWGDFFSFKFLITPIIIRVVYLIGAVLITLAALVALLQGGAQGLVSGILIFLFGQLFFRVYLEIVMLFFGMHDALRAIERQRR